MDTMYRFMQLVVLALCGCTNEIVLVRARWCKLFCLLSQVGGGIPVSECQRHLLVRIHFGQILLKLLKQSILCK